MPLVLYGLLALLCLVMPSSFIVQSPGPVMNVAGEFEGTPIVAVSGVDTYESDTILLMTTVNARGTGEAGATGFEVLYALAKRDVRVFPVRALYSPLDTREQVREANQQMMDNSQAMAAAVAQEQVGYTVSMTLTVSGIGVDSPSTGILFEGDIVRGIATPDVPMRTVDTFAQLSEVLDSTTPGTPVTVRIDRDGVEQDVEVVTRAYPPDVNGWVNPGSLLGIYITVTDIEMEAEVSYIIDGIGGPSAGGMFTLAILDELTPGSLGGESVIAGTGTITWDGDIGAIGGIRQKMSGAWAAGATDFIAPVTNCQETVGYVPDGLNVWAVWTIDDAVEVAEAVAAGDTSGLTSCQTVAEQVPQEYRFY